MPNHLIDHVLTSLDTALWAILTPLPFFILLAFVAKRMKLLEDVKRAMPETRINLLIHFMDAIIVAPLLAILAVLMDGLLAPVQLTAIFPDLWSGAPVFLVGFVAVFAGDFIAYWRHRAEHSALLWPSHAIHHSDTEMTWLAIFRFHPVNRLSTMLMDFGFLLLLGLPPYALLVNTFIRHFYGGFIHADVPWTYGPLKYIFVSPAMHRWHHAKDPAFHGTNFATVDRTKIIRTDEQLGPDFHPVD